MATKLAVGFLPRNNSLGALSIYAPLTGPLSQLGSPLVGSSIGNIEVPTPVLTAAGQIYFKEAMESWPDGFASVPSYNVPTEAEPTGAGPIDVGPANAGETIAEELAELPKVMLQAQLHYLYALMTTLAGDLRKSNEWLWVYLSLFWGHNLLHTQMNHRVAVLEEVEAQELVVTALLKHMDRPDNEPNRRDFKTLLTLSPSPLKLLVRYALPVMALVRFSRFSDEEQNLFFQLLGDHSWKRNILSEFIENLYDLDERSTALQNLITLSENLTAKQARFRQTWLREKITEYRYPRWAAKNKEVRTALANIPQIKGVTVRTGDGLEDNFLTAEIRIRNSADLDRLILSLDSGSWQDAVRNALNQL